MSDEVTITRSGRFTYSVHIPWLRRFPGPIRGGVTFEKVGRRRANRFAQRKIREHLRWLAWQADVTTVTPQENP